jgi:hypothetical protein
MQCVPSVNMSTLQIFLQKRGTLLGRFQHLLSASCCNHCALCQSITVLKIIRIFQVLYGMKYRSGDKSLARPTSRCCRTESIVSLEIHAILRETLGEYAPSYATVKNWVAQFKHGDFSTLFSLVGLRTYQHPRNCFFNFQAHCMEVISCVSVNTVQYWGCTTST